MSQATEGFGPDLSEAIPETFDVCPDCGTPTIQLSSHTCPDPDTVDEPTREDLDARIRDDPYPAHETVLVIQTAGRRSYAYHETNESGDPLCPVKHNRLEHLARTEAQEQRYAPCQFCQRIRDTNPEVTESMSTTMTLEDGECPCCQSAITAITANSPSQHTLQPCGCTLPAGATARTGGECR